MNKKRSGIDVGIPTSRGQVTIFIIFGILVLLVVVLIFALQSEVLTFKPEEIVPSQRGRVETFVSQCLEQVGEEALVKVGTHSGFIEVPTYLAQDISRHVRLTPFTVVPYWLTQTNKHIQGLDVIKDRVDRHIEANLRDCLYARGDYEGNEPFSEIYDFVELTDLKSDTEFVNAKTLFNVEWGLEVREKSGEVISELLEHVGESDYRVKKLHDLAVQIVEKELGDLKLEDITQDLIALEHDTLPAAGFEVSCSPKKWNVAEVKDTLQQMLRYNLARLQIKGSDVIEYPEGLGYYENHYVWDLGEVAEPEVQVRFKYEPDLFPFLFQVTPATGTVMKSSSLGGHNLLKAVCLQSWKFTYDVEYPVLVVLRDAASGYEFNMAMSVHLVRNLPNRGASIEPRASVGLGLIDDEIYCNDARVPMNVQVFELIENGDGVSDSLPLAGADVSLTCLKYRCELGKSAAGFEGFRRNMPYCSGGIFRAEKEGYVEDFKRVPTREGEVVDLHLLPLYEDLALKLRVVKHELLDGDRVGEGEELGSNELAQIRISFKANESVAVREVDYEEQITVGAQLEGVYTESERRLDQKGLNGNVRDTLGLLAGANYKYELEINVVDPKESHLTGVYMGNWSVSWDELQGASEIIFHVVGSDGTDNGAIEVMLGRDQFSRLVSEPEIK